MKPTFTAIAVTTLDGKIAKNKNHNSFSWNSKEDQKYFLNEIKKYDVGILGYSTFKLHEKSCSKRNCIVFTRNPKRTSKSNKVIFIKPTKPKLLSILKKNNWKNVCILGGSKVYTWFLKNNLLNQLMLTIEPIVFGGGIDIFHGKFPNKKFKLISTKKLNQKGTLLLKYKN